MKSVIAARMGLDLDLEIFCTQSCDEMRVPIRWFAGVEVPIGENFHGVIIRESLFTYRTREALEQAMNSSHFPIDQDPFTDGEGRRQIFRAER